MSHHSSSPPCLHKQAADTCQFAVDRLVALARCFTACVWGGGGMLYDLHEGAAADMFEPAVSKAKIRLYIHSS